MNELSPITMSNTIDKYIIITFSIVNNPCPYHPYMFITGNCSSKFKIIPIWAPAPNSLAENGISKKNQDMSLLLALSEKWNTYIKFYVLIENFYQWISTISNIYHVNFLYRTVFVTLYPSPRKRKYKVYALYFQAVQSSVE